MEKSRSSWIEQAEAAKEELRKAKENLKITEEKLKEYEIKEKKTREIDLSAFEIKPSKHSYSLDSIQYFLELVLKDALSGSNEIMFALV